jgi:hypothetical protein
VFPALVQARQTARAALAQIFGKKELVYFAANLFCGHPRDMIRASLVIMAVD